MGENTLFLFYCIHTVGVTTIVPMNWKNGGRKMTLKNPKQTKPQTKLKKKPPKTKPNLSLPETDIELG